MSENTFDISAFRRRRQQTGQDFLSTTTLAPGAGVGFMDRAAMGFATTPQGEEAILRQRGFNPLRGPDGALYVEKDGIRQRVDPETLELSDIADMAGAVPSTVLSALGGVGAAAATAPTGPGALMAGSAAAGAGAAAGDALRQKIGQSLGSGEDFSGMSMAKEAALGAAGEGVSRGVLRLLAPLGKAARGTTPRTSDIVQQGRQLDRSFGTNVTDLLPPDARSESAMVGQLAQRVRESPFAGPKFQKAVDEPFQAEAHRLGQRISNRASQGQSAKGGVAAAEAVETARQSAIRQQRAQVDEAFAQVRELLPPDTVVEPLQTLDAIDDIAGQLRPLAEFDTASSTYNLAERMADDIHKIRTFDQMDAFRKWVGDQLDGSAEQFNRQGFDAQLARLYGALRADVERVAASTGKVGQTANALAREQVEITQAPITRQLRVGDKLETLVSGLARRPAREIERLKQALGVVETDAGFKATGEGAAAWAQIQAEVLDDLFTRSAHRLSTSQAPRISGEKLSSELTRMGPDRLKALFGVRSATDLEAFATFLRDSNSAERAFANFSGTSRGNNMFEFIRLLVQSPGQAVGFAGAQVGMGALLRNPRTARIITGEQPFSGPLQSLLSTAVRAGTQGTAQTLTNRN